MPKKSKKIEVAAVETNVETAVETNVPAIAEMLEPVIADNEELDQLLSQLDETELKAIAEDTTGEQIEEPSSEGEAPSEDDQAPGDDEVETEAFLEMVAAVEADEETLETHRAAIDDAFEERADYQRTKNSANETIQASLKKSRAKLVQGRAVATLLAADVMPDFMNRQTNEGSAYNVYAIDKVADLVSALNTGVIGNAINRAVCKSLFRFRAAGEQFTGEMARAAVSDKLRVQGQVAKLLVRHTVSSATAPTQASSTMQALTTLGIVKNIGTTRAPIYQLTDTAQTKRLEEVVAAAA